MAGLAQGLQVVGIVGSAECQRPYVIDFGGGCDPPLSFAVGAQREAGKVRQAYCLPSLVVAACGWAGSWCFGRTVGRAPRPVLDYRRAARRTARPTYPGRHTSINRHTPSSLCSGTMRQVRSSVRYAVCLDTWYSTAICRAVNCSPRTSRIVICAARSTGLISAYSDSIVSPDVLLAGTFVLIIHHGSCVVTCARHRRRESPARSPARRVWRR